MDERIWRKTLLFLAVALVGCRVEPSDQNGEAPQASARDSAAATTDPDPDPDDPEDKGLIVLTKPATQYSPEELRALVPEDKWMAKGGVSKRRQCKSGAESLDCQLLIHPLAGSRELDVNNAPEHGAIVARIQNIGREREEFLGIDPGKENEVFYLVRRRTNGPGAEAVRLYFATSVVTESAPKPVDSCTKDKDPNHKHEKWSRAAFRCCGACPDDAAPQDSMRAREPRASHKTPPWFVCANGCCYSDETR